MKYIVELKYTNPSHEHVSLRRRVESTSRLVEAANEQEAVFRATRQQKALGFMIKEAKATVVQEATKKVDFVKFGKDILAQRLEEGFDTDPKDIAAYLVNRHGKGKVTMDHIEAYERGRDSHRPIEKNAVMQHVKKMSEEVETVDEADVTKDLRTSMKMMDLRHGVDSDKRVSGYKMSAVVRSAQKKFDAQSKGQGKMRPQAGTLPAKKISEDVELQYIEEKLTAADPASKWISDFVASDNPKFAGKSKKERIQMALGAHYAAKRAKNEEVVDEAKKTEQKKEDGKKAEGRENVLQGKVNKINMEPKLDHTVGGVK
jgi:hypothetical protein